MALSKRFIIIAPTTPHNIAAKKIPKMLASVPNNGISIAIKGTDIKSFSKTKSDSLFDYFMGGKKTEEIMKENQMKREEIAMLKDGTFLKDKDVPLMQKRWCKYAENSNIQMTVLSFYQNYIDENINISFDNGNIIMERDNNESNLLFNFVLDKETESKYFIKNLNFYIDTKVKTNHLQIDDDRIIIEYDLWLSDEYSGNFKYEIILKEV